MKVVYIAGPYRAKNAWLVEQNIRLAEIVAFSLANLGAIPLCPHTMYRYFNGTQTDEFWLNGTLELLKRCDAIFVLKTYKQSQGSVQELDLATKLNLPIFFQDELLDNIRLTGWLKDDLQWKPNALSYRAV